MSTVAIIQAHMSSTRLPGKVLLDLHGETVLGRVVRRARLCTTIDEVVVAISNSQADDVLLKECERLGVRSFRGSEDDVLDRYFHAAVQAKADVCVRITSDCPLLDPGVSDSIVSQFHAANPPVDYASNKIPQSFPRGLDTEAFSIDALEKTWRWAEHAYERTHVTAHMYENPDTFRLMSITSDVDRANWRWTLDTADDLEFLRTIFGLLPDADRTPWTEVVKLIEGDPALLNINAHVPQKAVREG